MKSLKRLFFSVTPTEQHRPDESRSFYKSREHGFLKSCYVEQTFKKDLHVWRFLFSSPFKGSPCKAHFQGFLEPQRHRRGWLGIAGTRGRMAPSGHRADSVSGRIEGGRSNPQRKKRADAAFRSEKPADVIEKKEGRECFWANTKTIYGQLKVASTNEMPLAQNLLLNK